MYSFTLVALTHTYVVFSRDVTQNACLLRGALANY